MTDDGKSYLKLYLVIKFKLETYNLRNMNIKFIYRSELGEFRASNARNFTIARDVCTLFDIRNQTKEILN